MASISKIKQKVFNLLMINFKNNKKFYLENKELILLFNKISRKIWQNKNKKMIKRNKKKKGNLG